MTCSCSDSAKLWIAAILAIVVIGALTACAYSSEQNALKEATILGMKSTASVMATQIHPSEFANISPGDEMNTQYAAAANHLRTMRSMDDNIMNAYILKVYPNRTTVFIVDDLYPVDPQGSAKIGEVSTAPDTMAIFGALSGPTATEQPYTTKYGSFMSAYAPIDDSPKDSTGNTVAVLAIDVSARDFLKYTAQGWLILLLGAVSMIIAVGAIFWFGRKAGQKPE